MPKNMTLLVDEHHDDLALAGDLQGAAEAVFVHIERDDPGPRLRVGFVAAHGGVFPPAEDDIFRARDGHTVPAKVEVGVLEGLGEGHPGVDVGSLFGLEGDEQQIELSGKIPGKRELGFAEIVGDEGREESRFG